MTWKKENLGECEVERWVVPANDPDYEWVLDPVSDDFNYCKTQDCIDREELVAIRQSDIGPEY